jgi:hypothetical protein
MAWAQQPQVKVNMLNVCTPSAGEQQEIASALAQIPRQPAFAPDFEVDRGRSTLDETPDFLKTGSNTQMSSEPSISNWVRIRREFPAQAVFSTVQYSFSVDDKSMSETVTFRLRDPKDLMQVSIEDSASAVTSPATMLSTNTPANRIRLERFGKSSIVLARCPGVEGSAAPDQKAYEPLFQSATAIVSSYRSLLGARHTIPDELSRVAAVTSGSTKPSGSATKKPPVKKSN